MLHQLVIDAQATLRTPVHDRGPALPVVLAPVPRRRRRIDVQDLQTDHLMRLSDHQLIQVTPPPSLPVRALQPLTQADDLGLRARQLVGRHRLSHRMLANLVAVALLLPSRSAATCTGHYDRNTHDPSTAHS